MPIKKPVKLAIYIKGQLDAGITQPTVIKENYERQYPNIKPKTLQCYSNSLRRMGANKEQRSNIIQAEKKRQAERDIEDYSQVKSYILVATRDGVQQKQVTKQTTSLRKLWELMNRTDPTTWSEEAIMTRIYETYPMKLDENDRKVFEHPAAIKSLLSPFNTMFQGKLSKNWSANLCIHKAGELKDFFNFIELDEFLEALTADSMMSLEGWQAMVRIHINIGCREGSLGKTGITSLLWEDINLTTMRASLREKGHRGNAGERWNNLPLDLFSFLEAKKYLLAWWEQCGKPIKGEVFKAKYKDYNNKFHITRQKCQSRIKEDSETMRLHIFRREHGQIASRLGIPLEYICGDAPDGRFGVGWKDPKIPLRYYISQEYGEIPQEELEYMQKTPRYKEVLAIMLKVNEERRKWSQGGIN